MYSLTMDIKLTLDASVQGGFALLEVMLVPLATLRRKSDNACSVLAVG